jgi:hypothetical protein
MVANFFKEFCESIYSVQQQGVLFGNNFPTLKVNKPG